MKFGKISRYILFGGSSLLYRFACYLIDSDIDCIVITSKRHAEECLESNKSLKDLLETKGIPYISTSSLNKDVYSEITKDTIGISFGAAWIFKQDFIDRFNGRLLNCHPTRLPRYRGGAHFSWRILMNDRFGVNTVHFVDTGIDTGDLLEYDEYIFPEGCKKPIDFMAYSAERYLFTLKNLVLNINKDIDFNVLKQQDSFSSYFPRLNTDIHGYIDWSWDLESIYQFICAFDDPYKGASTFLGEDRIYLKDAYLNLNEGHFHPFQAGLVYRVSSEAIYIACLKGTLIVKGVYNSEAKDIKNKIIQGSRLLTPVSYLEKALDHRAVYIPDGLKDS